MTSHCESRAGYEAGTAEGGADNMPAFFVGLSLSASASFSTLWLAGKEPRRTRQPQRLSGIRSGQLHTSSSTSFALAASLWVRKPLVFKKGTSTCPSQLHSASSRSCYHQTSCRRC